MNLHALAERLTAFFNQEPSLKNQAMVLLIVAALVTVLLIRKTLYRTVAREVLRPAVTGIIIFVVLFVSNALLFNLMDFLLNQKVPALVVLKVLVYQLPAIALMAVPVAFLLGVVLGLGRMGQDYEMLAMRIGGLSFFRVCMPVYALALLVSLSVLMLNQTLVPIANRKSQDLLRQYLVRAAIESSQTGKVIQGPEGRVFLLEKGGKNLALFDPKDSNDWPTLFTAKEVIWAGSQWQLSGGQVLKLDKAGRIVADLRVDKLLLSLDPEVQGFTNPVISAQEKTIEELSKDLKTTSVATEVGMGIQADIHGKLTLPFATLCLALVATPLVIATARVRYGSFLFAVLAAGFYYVGLGLAPSLAKAGLLLPKLAEWGLPPNLIEKLAPIQAPITVWIPTALFAVVGVLLTWRVSRR